MIYVNGNKVKSSDLTLTDIHTVIDNLIIFMNIGASRRNFQIRIKFKE